MIYPTKLKSFVSLYRYFDFIPLSPPWTIAVIMYMYSKNKTQLCNWFLQVPHFCIVDKHVCFWSVLPPYWISHLHGHRNAPWSMTHIGRRLFFFFGYGTDRPHLYFFNFFFSAMALIGHTHIFILFSFFLVHIRK